MKFASIGLLFLLLLLSPGIGKAAEPDSASMASVTVKPLSSLVIQPRKSAPGLVVSLNDTQISPEIAGKIIEMAVEVGVVVDKGAVIARLDPWLYASQLREAQGLLEELEVGLKLAERERDRSKKLRAKGQTSQAVLDTKRANVDRLLAQLTVQRSRLAESRTRLEKTIIKTPFSGIVSQRTGQLGGWVGPGSPVVRLVDLERVELSAQVGSRQIGQLEKAASLNFIHLENRYPVTIRSLIPLEKTATQTHEVRLTFIQSAPPPGAAGRLTWKDARDHLPPSLLVRRNGGLGLFFAEAVKAVFLPLANAREGLPALLPEGVAGQVVIDGREALRHGVSISITSTTD
jgi:RND family efflux transporter MFP subunit